MQNILSNYTEETKKVMQNFASSLMATCLYGREAQEKSFNYVTNSIETMRSGRHMSDEAFMNQKMNRKTKKIQRFITNL